jgi:hypothetical protein
MRRQDRRTEARILDKGIADDAAKHAAWMWKGVVDSDDFSRQLAHDSTTVNVDLLNFRVRDENG